MKKILLILFAALPAFGQLSLQTVNTSNLQTNVVTTTKVISIPGVVTNGVATVTETNIIVGDTLATAFGKVNSNKDALKSVLRTNGAPANGYIPYKTNDATGFGWKPSGVETNGGTNGQYVVIDPTVPGGHKWTNAPSGGSGVGNATNAIPIYNGGGFNLSVTNKLTLINTNLIGYALGSIYYTSTNDPNANGTYTLDPTTGTLTNQSGYVMTAFPMGTNGTIDGLVATNTPLVLKTNMDGGFIVVTNSPTGWTVLNGTYTFTNGPVHNSSENARTNGFIGANGYAILQNRAGGSFHNYEVCLPFSTVYYYTTNNVFPEFPYYGQTSGTITNNAGLPTPGPTFIFYLHYTVTVSLSPPAGFIPTIPLVTNADGIYVLNGGPVTNTIGGADYAIYQTNNTTGDNYTMIDYNHSGSYSWLNGLNNSNNYVAMCMGITPGRGFALVVYPNKTNGPGSCAPKRPIKLGTY